MDKNLDVQIVEALKAYLASGVEEQVDYQKFYFYSIVTHSTAIEGIAAKSRTLIKQNWLTYIKDCV